jgi:hypothetical protein
LSQGRDIERDRQISINENQYATAMLAALTANINRAENTEPIHHTSFLKYPAAEVPLISGLSCRAIAVSLNIVPPTKLAENMLGEREALIGNYIWLSDRWLYK